MDNTTTPKKRQKNKIDIPQQTSTVEQPEPKNISDILIDRFDCEAMGRHSHLLGMAARSLEMAYQVTGAVATIADVLRADLIAKDFGENVFSTRQEDRLLYAIDFMSSGVLRELDNTADFMSKALKDSAASSAKGGAQ